jgi:hypothetical protein
MELAQNKLMEYKLQLMEEQEQHRYLCNRRYNWNQ